MWTSSELCMCEEIARGQQSVRISVDSRRYGKMVTVIDGIDENDINIADLAKQLKNKCAAGRTYKDGRIELQGDHKESESGPRGDGIHNGSKMNEEGGNREN